MLKTETKNTNMPSFEEVMAFFGINPAMGKATRETQERIKNRPKRVPAAVYGPEKSWVMLAQGGLADG